MPHCKPPKEHSFPRHRQNHTKKGPYLVPLLRRMLKKKISFEDPETQKIIKGRVNDAVLWRLILNATQGETPAIKEILDRIDGKVKDKTEHSVADETSSLFLKALSRLEK